MQIFGSALTSHAMLTGLEGESGKPGASSERARRAAGESRQSGGAQTEGSVTLALRASVHGGMACLQDLRSSVVAVVSLSNRRRCFSRHALRVTLVLWQVVTVIYPHLDAIYKKEFQH